MSTNATSASTRNVQYSDYVMTDNGCDYEIVYMKELPDCTRFRGFFVPNNQENLVTKKGEPYILLESEHHRVALQPVPMLHAFEDGSISYGTECIVDYNGKDTRLDGSVGRYHFSIMVREHERPAGWDADLWAQRYHESLADCNNGEEV